ncbi:hypothetical protein AVEN_225764-1 [Araneus ventricosus]|uniref:STPR domain-containing protein n=1 Tax=Araneus ventricosus TaxID=182803 RepID=A0A4Y2N7F3_ARAVE|nr:hypothetical protein AVEN_225764-1 [Araneus ventricosus]
MLPLNSRQIENVKGELLKLTKKETMAQCSLDRRAEETEEQNNSRLSVMAQRGQKRRAKETEGQRNSRLSAMVTTCKRTPSICYLKSKLPSDTNFLCS